jgi:hypothetical protein
MVWKEVLTDLVVVIVGVLIAEYIGKKFLGM